jgi:hypothetical protein
LEDTPPPLPEYQLIDITGGEYKLGGREKDKEKRRKQKKEIEVKKGNNAKGATIKPQRMRVE